MTFASIALPVVALRWRLNGPAGLHLDAVVAALVSAGVQVEAITPATAYRLKGNTELLDVLGEELGKVEGFELKREMPPVDTVQMRSTLTNPHPFRRSVTVHGDGGRSAASFVARAVDMGLAVLPVGVGHWTVSARTADLVRWLAAIYVKTHDEVLTLFNWSSESIAAEDAAVPVVTVTLPTTLDVDVRSMPARKSVSTVTRDAEGEISNVVQIESDTK